MKMVKICDDVTANVIKNDIRVDWYDKHGKKMQKNDKNMWWCETWVDVTYVMITMKTTRQSDFQYLTLVTCNYLVYLKVSSYFLTVMFRTIKLSILYWTEHIWT
jgi:hypothetical protein